MSGAILRRRDRTARSLRVVHYSSAVNTEVVWFNFAPDRVHWASYAGRNFTDRQRIKRKAAN